MLQRRRPHPRGTIHGNAACSLPMKRPKHREVARNRSVSDDPVALAWRCTATDHDGSGYPALMRRKSCAILHHTVQPERSAQRRVLG